MRYVPYEESHNLPNIVAHGRGNERSVLVLSNLPQAGTPLDFKADTSVETVFRFLQSNLRYRFSEINVVTSSHLCVDALLSVWAMLHPEKAVACRPVLCDAAYTSDFCRITKEDGMRLGITLSLLLGYDFSNFTILSKQCTDRDMLMRRFQETLLQVETILESPYKYSEYWKPKIEQIQEDTIVLNEKGYLNEFPHVDLAVFDLPQDVNLIPLFSSAKYHKILVILPGPKYHLHYKYETWVELESYIPPPRVDLTELAHYLQKKENHNEGDWKWDGVSAPRPALSFVADNNMLADSHISPQALLANLIRYLEDSATRQDLIWTPKNWKQ